MKKLTFVLPLALTAILFSCGGDKESDIAGETVDTTVED